MTNPYSFFWVGVGTVPEVGIEPTHNQPPATPPILDEFPFTTVHVISPPPSSFPLLLKIGFDNDLGLGGLDLTRFPPLVQLPLPPYPSLKWFLTPERFMDFAPAPRLDYSWLLT